MRLMILLPILLCMLFSMSVLAGDGGVQDAAVESVGIGDIVSGVGDIVDKAKDYKGAEGSGKLVGLMALLAAIFKLLMSAIKLISKTFFKSTKGKNIIKLVTLLLGVGTFIVSNIALGQTWWEALILSFSGPMAMVLHEFTKLVPAIRKAKG
jgi:hypothetical protein